MKLSATMTCISMMIGSTGLAQVVHPTSGDVYVLLPTDSWSNSQALARSAFVDLITIESQEENDWIYSVFAQACPTCHGAWIGYNDFATEGEFAWSDGSDSEYTNWQPGTPDGGLEENAVEMLLNHPDGNGGYWNDLFDAGRPNHAIVQVHAHLFRGHAYALIGPASWTECAAAAEVLGANLVTIDSQEENDWLLDTFGSDCGSCHGAWIGFNDFASEGDWVWSSGRGSGYTNWQIGTPDGGLEENGAEMLLNHPDGEPGSWNDLFDAGRPNYAIIEFGCAGDFNDDGFANTLDVIAFLNAWASGDPWADFNNDGTINTLDVLEFLNAWSAGCP